VGDSPAIRLLREQIEDVAHASGPVLIVGESGTGKELVAQTLHRLRSGEARPFVAVNCSALPHELMESELFGHERGAFTGSRQSAIGLMRAAEDGSVFLDEITEMPLALQPKLLRALEQRAVRPLGGLREIAFGARIIAATNRDPEATLSQGQLRSDLFYRLCVHRVEVPALRSRLGDIPALVEHFLALAAADATGSSRSQTPKAISADALSALMNYAWPGNVRELRNAIDHACARARSGVIDTRDLPRALFGRPSLPGADPQAPIHLAHAENWPKTGTAANDVSLAPLHVVEREHIERALRAVGGNKTQAAELLGLSRHQLYLRLERLGLYARSEAQSCSGGSGERPRQS
jgi:DNA-binding NtrC family response regulator